MFGKSLPRSSRFTNTHRSALSLMDMDYRFVRINERMAEMDGSPKADIGRTLREVLPDLADYIMETLPPGL